MRTIRSIEDAKALEGEEVGLSDWVVIDQHRIDQFAEATADYQWIHVDTERAAKEMPNGKTIAHGYLTLALIPALTGKFVEVVNLERAINFGLNKVRFYAPVPVGAKLRGRATVLQVRAPGRPPLRVEGLTGGATVAQLYARVDAELQSTAYVLTRATRCARSRASSTSKMKGCQICRNGPSIIVVVR